MEATNSVRQSEGYKNKLDIIQWLLNNDFRCKTDEGTFMSRTTTSDILLAWNIAALEKTKLRYNEAVVIPRTRERKEAACIFRRCLHVAGLTHWITKDVRRKNELALAALLH